MKGIKLHILGIYCKRNLAEDKANLFKALKLTKGMAVEEIKEMKMKAHLLFEFINIFNLQSSVQKRTTGAKQGYEKLLVAFNYVISWDP